MTTPRFRNRVSRIPETCGRCGGPCPAIYRYCDGCSQPATVLRRSGARQGMHNPGALAQAQERAAATLELSEHNAELEKAIAALEAGAEKATAFATRITRFVRNGERGVVCIETKRLRATAIAGAGDRDEMESPR